MAQEAAYSTDWLATRYDYDAAARNRGLEIAARQFLSGKKYLQLVDAGAGDGGNCCYFLDRFPQDQHWWLIEQDPYLATQALPRITAFGKTHGYSVTRIGPILRLHNREKIVDIEVIHGSVFALDALVDLVGIDMILANALFDLFSEAQFQQLASVLAPHDTAFYSTINYCGMRFIPEHPDDLQVISWYEAHMQRTQAFGQAMGKHCPERMENALTAAGFSVVRGSSTWQIEVNDRLIKEFLLSFMEEAIGEKLENDDDRYFFRYWTGRMRRTHNWRAEVYHEDLLGLPTTQKS